MGFWNKEICGFQPYNNEEGTLPEYSDEQIKAMIEHGDIVVGEDGLPKVVPRPQPTVEDIKANLRIQREALLEAFDKWEKAVLRGREQDDYAIMLWYQDLLDLKESAFESVPERVKYYL